MDFIASNLIGKLVLDYPKDMWPVMDAWIDDENLWIRRTAILCQLKHKSCTDKERLFRYATLQCKEPDFFIRKAIGWSLREFAKTDPNSVQTFLVANRQELSPLSFREAAKHLNIQHPHRPKRARKKKGGVKANETIEGIPQRSLRKRTKRN